MTDGLAGLRRQLTFEEAAKLADVEGPPLSLDYPALRLTQSPLFQRMAEKLDNDITSQNMARNGEIERQNNITNLSMQSGLNRQDLEEIIAQIGRVQGPPGPSGPAGGMGPPRPCWWYGPPRPCWWHGSPRPAGRRGAARQCGRGGRGWSPRSAGRGGPARPMGWDGPARPARSSRNASGARLEG
jgi:hypothetical protein